jgi:hypothetical protein
MIINFRQGIITYPSIGGVQQFLVSSGGNVSLSTSNGVIDVAFAHRQSNYLHTESTSIPAAWSALPQFATVWLYWDLDKLTATRTFGYTELEPVAQPTAPLAPETDQHWFDTSVNYMKVWTGSRWQEKIRVFAAQYDTGTQTFTSVSINSTAQRFDGTQAGLTGSNFNTGRIIVDNTGRPILNQSGEFFTTEDDFFINGSPINTIRLEANILTASPVENVAEYQVVAFTDFDRVSLASYHDLQDSAIAIAVQDILKDDVGSFVVQGIITNPAWNWTTVGAQLWVSEGGALVEADPHTTDASTYNVGKAPVGRVISRHSIIFDQGLGGKGDKGDSALSSSGIGEAATMFDLGKVKLTAEPTDPGSPYAVETNDPRMSDARQPLPHTHPATEIQPIAYGTTINGDLQTTLQNIDGVKVNKTGDTMTGALLLKGNPIAPLEAAPKQYVDTFVPLSQRGAANGVATLDSTGKITQSQLPQIALTNTYVVSSQADMLLLNAQSGDLAVRTDIHTTFILKGTNATVLADWQELLTTPDGVVWLDVVPAAGTTGITTSGGPVTSSGTISISLSDDLLALESLNTTGVAHRTGNNTWELKAVDLAAGGNVVTGVLPVANGGTGHNQVFGYLKGTGTSFTQLSAIPGADVNGPVAQSLSTPWSGVTNTPTTLAGYGITNAYTKAEVDARTMSWSSLYNTPTSLIGYGITDVYSKTEVNTLLLSKANVATTLAGYGITDAASLSHSHILDNLTNVNTAGKAAGDVIYWNGTQWVNQAVSNAVLPNTISGKTFDDSNIVYVKDANFSVIDDVDTTKVFKFQASNIAANTTRTYLVPNADGTLALTDGTGAYGSWNINAASASAVAWSGVNSTPTTLVGYGIIDAYTKTETNNLTWNWSAITNRPTTASGYGITDVYTKTETNNLTWNWSAITNRPTTLVGYGILDAYTKTETNNLTWNWSAITNRPTTLAGYGITDAATLTHNHDTVYVKLTDVGTTVASLDYTGKVPKSQLPDSVETDIFTVDNEIAMLNLPASKGDIAIRTDISTTYILVNDDPTQIVNWIAFLAPTADGVGSVNYVAINGPSEGVSVTGGPITSSGTFTVSLTNDLAALEGLTTTGFAKRTGTDSWSTQASIDLTADASGILPVVNGGTGASTAQGARLNLNTVSTTGDGATGTWNINISGNAVTVSNGVYTTQQYNDPSWIATLDASKIVGTLAGVQVSNELNFDGVSSIISGSTTSTGLTPVVVNGFNATVFSSAKYLVQIRVPSTGAVNLTELYVYIDGNNDVYFTEAGPQYTPIATLTAVYNVNTQEVEIIATPLSNVDATYKFSATMFTA